MRRLTLELTGPLQRAAKPQGAKMREAQRLAVWPHAVAGPVE